MHHFAYAKTEILVRYLSPLVVAPLPANSKMANLLYRILRVQTPCFITRSHFTPLYHHYYSKNTSSRNAISNPLNTAMDFWLPVSTQELISTRPFPHLVGHPVRAVCRQVVPPCELERHSGHSMMPGTDRRSRAHPSPSGREEWAF